MERELLRCFRNILKIQISIYSEIFRNHQQVSEEFLFFPRKDRQVTKFCRIDFRS